MEIKEYDAGMLTFEDRYVNVPPYKFTDTNLEDELLWAQVTEKCCERSGVLGQYHEEHCDHFED